jgi:nucleoside-diphosphate-sugar epimerase
VIPTIISQALAGATLKLGTLETTRDFTFVEDTARGFAAVAASEDAVGQVVNLGSGTEVSIGDVVAKVAAIVGREFEVATDDQRLRPQKSEVSRLHSDSTKALKLAGWRAEVSLDEGLRRTTEWIRAHLHEYRTEEYAV